MSDYSELANTMCMQFVYTMCTASILHTATMAKHKIVDKCMYDNINMVSTSHNNTHDVSVWILMQVNKNERKGEINWQRMEIYFMNPFTACITIREEVSFRTTGWINSYS